METRKSLAQTRPELDIESARGLILTDEQYIKHPFTKSERRSYTFVIVKGNKYLSYFGSDHTKKPGDPLFAEINQAFKEAKPQLVLVEGVEFINDRKEEIKDISKKMSLEDSIIQRGESGYVFKLAIDTNVDFESPEPSFNLEIQMLLDCGYSKKDIFTFYVYRSIYEYQREHEEKNTRSLKEYLLPHLEKFRTSSGWSKEEIDSFVNELFSDIDLSSEKYKKESDPIPWEADKQVVTNNISRTSSSFRDRYMVERIAEALKKYDRVFIIYGSGHAVKQEPAIRALLA